MTATDAETGFNGLQAALRTAKRSGRAAKVAALLVPLAVIAAQHSANAITSTGQSGTSIINNVCGGSGGTVTLDWDVSHPSTTLYHYTFSIIGSGAGCGTGFAEVDVPLMQVGDAFNVTAPTNWSEALLLPTDTGYDWTTAGITPGEIIQFKRTVSSANPPISGFAFDSDFAPDTTPPYQATFNGNTLVFDTPVPNDPVIIGVPEPASLGLFGVALAGFFAWRRRLTS